MRAAILSLSFCLLPLAGALAHTTIKSQATEGVRDDNALRISHGCEGDRAVIAQSSPTGLAQSIQDASIFAVQDETVDANVVGFQARKGKLEDDLVGRVPFQFNAPNFVPESCAVRLLIKVAIADICSTKQPVLEVDTVNLWIPDNGSAIAVAGPLNGVEGIGGAATLIVNRNLLLNPRPESARRREWPARDPHEQHGPPYRHRSRHAPEPVADDALAAICCSCRSRDPAVLNHA